MSETTPRRPHIVLILADNLGWGELRVRFEYTALGAQCDHEKEAVVGEYVGEKVDVHRPTR
jgi:hypothetical protein